ncbi:MAG: transposase [Phycisphaerales bacterium]|nr:transposase [Phycisphaerales bacterium]
MNPPLGFFLTFRTYGTWLHGDARGSVDELHNTYGTPMIEPDEQRERREVARMGGSAMVFDEAMRQLATDALIKECAFRRWNLIAYAVRSNHVHVVVAYAHIRPEEITRNLKSRITRILRTRNAVRSDQRVWAAGTGSRKYLWTEQDVANAAKCVTEYQNEPRTR